MRRAALLLPALLGACVGELADSSDVRDLRVLAIRAEPPEVVQGQDGPPVALEALVADPRDPDRSVAWEWHACGLTDDLRCLSDPNAETIGSGQGGLDEVAVSFEVTGELVASAREFDTFMGFGGVYVMTELVLFPGQEEEFHAIKQLPVPLALPSGTDPNTNPGPPDLLHDDEAWPADDVLVVTPGQEVSIEPVSPPEDAQRYSVFRFDLQTEELEESLEYRFFATEGSWNRNQSGGPPSPVVTETTLASIWTAPDPAPAEDITFWVVVRDGRGGLDWTMRTARVQE